MAFNKEKVGIILLGAQRFPESKFTPSEAFLNAHKTIKDYFLKTILESQNPNDDRILDLFDSEFDPNRIDKEITDFIKNRPKLGDLILYYVGHGGFDTQAGFILAIRQSRDSNLGISSIVAKSLGKTLSKIAGDRRLYIILDCCFAAQLYQAFQSPLLDVVGKEVGDSFPQNGIALLSASSKDKPAMILEGGVMTMFTDALGNVLNNGSPSTDAEFLTLRQLGDLTFRYIKGKNPADAIMPEVHSPKMPQGDIADVPTFLNKAFVAKRDEAIAHVPANDIFGKEKEIRKYVRQDNLEMVSKLLIDFVEGFNEEMENVIKEPILSRACYLHLQQKVDATNKEEYAKYLTDREELYNRILIMVVAIRVYWKKKLSPQNGQ